MFTLRKRTRKPEVEPIRIKLGTVRVSSEAYDALTTLQHHYRRETGKALSLWKIVDAAIIAYARQGSSHFGG